MTTPTLRVRSGDGRLARTGDALLYTTAGAGADGLVEVFRHAPAEPDLMVDALTDHVLGAPVGMHATVDVGTGAMVDGFVLVVLGARLRLLAFGDVQVTTDDP